MNLAKTKIVTLGITGLLAALLATATLIACGKREVANEPAQKAQVAMQGNNEDPQWVSRSTPRPKIAVVFIHGIFGSTLGTWTTAKGTTFFQLIKNTPEIGPKVDVFAFGFTSKMLGSGSLDIREAANKLEVYLGPAGVLDYPAIVFVGHSMGGLVALRYLTSNLDKDKSLAAKVPLVVLYGVPQEGALIAAVGDLALRNPALANMRPADNNDALKQLNDDWARLVHKPQVLCGYEKRETYGALIVPWGSSTRYCTAPGMAIEDEDHISMVKPDRATHPSVVMLVDALNKHVMPLQFGARLETPDFVAEGDHFNIVMDAPERSARLLNTGRAGLKYWIAEKPNSDLYITPDDTPRAIDGGGNLQMRLLLLAGVNDSKYQFVLKSDVPTEQRIEVLVPNLDRIRQQHAQNVQAVINALDAHLADPVVAKEMAALPPGDRRAAESMASAAFNAVSKGVPGLPPAATWLLTADALSTANFGFPAVAALRSAEAASPQSASTNSAQSLARKVELQSGERQIFRKALTTANDPSKPTRPSEARPGASPPAWLKSESSVDASIKLAARMKGFPALRSQGLALEGDVLQARGDSASARKAYVEAAGIEATPSLRAKLQTIDQTTPAASNDAGRSRDAAVSVGVSRGATTANETSAREQAERRAIVPSR